MKKINQYSIIVMILAVGLISSCAPPEICNYLCKAQLSPITGMGLNTKSEGGSDFGSAGTKVGGALGVSTGIPFTESFTFEPGLMLNSRGSKFKMDYGDGGDFGMGTEGKFEETTTDTYISAPMMGRVSLVKSLPGLNFIGGVQPSYLVGSKTKTSSSFGSGETEKGTDGRNKFDAGLLVGAGYKFDFGLKVDAVYDHGLTNLYQTSGDYKSRSFRLMVGYDLPFNPYSKRSWKK